MTDDRRLVAAAHKAVTDFVNGQNCQTKDEVMEVLHVLQAMAAEARLTVKYGKSEKLS